MTKLVKGGYCGKFGSTKFYEGSWFLRLIYSEGGGSSGLWEGRSLLLGGLLWLSALPTLTLSCCTI